MNSPQVYAFPIFSAHFKLSQNLIRQATADGESPT